MYIDVEKVVIDWLAARFPSARLCAELPNALPPLTVQVVEWPGDGPDVIPFADSNLDVDCYAASRSAAKDLAREVQHALMYELPGTKADGAILLSAFNISAPSWAPHDDTTVRRMTAAYRIRTHNPI